MHAGILPLLPLVCCLGTLEETRGLGAQEGQEGLGALEVPSLQGCPQLRPGQGSLGGPADLQWNQGLVGVLEAGRLGMAARGREGASWGSGY